MISDCSGSLRRRLLSRQPVCQRSGYWIPSRGWSPPMSMKLHGHASITALLLHAGLIDNVCYVLNIWWAGPRLSFGLTSRVTFRSACSKMPWAGMKRYAITSRSICTITIRGLPIRQGRLLWPKLPRGLCKTGPTDVAPRSS